VLALLEAVPVFEAVLGRPAPLGIRWKGARVMTSSDLRRGLWPAAGAFLALSLGWAMGGYSAYVPFLGAAGTYVAEILRPRRLWGSRMDSAKTRKP